VVKSSITKTIVIIINTLRVLLYFDYSIPRILLILFSEGIDINKYIGIDRRLYIFLAYILLDVNNTNNNKKLT